MQVLIVQLSKEHMRRSPIEQETQPIFPQSQEPTENPANAHHAAEESQEQYQCIGVQSALIAHVPQHQMRPTHRR
jgi:hypothetical protein